MTTVRDLGEFGLIRKLQKIIESNRLSRSAVAVGIGDDCAVLPSGDPGKFLLYTCDPVVEGVHYLAQTPPRQIGWKAMARNLSDIAAMGGLPRWAVVSIGLRPTTPVGYVERIYDGLRAAASKFGCQVVGGDTTHVRREQFVVVTLLGEVEKRRLTLRSGAKIGDAVFVTGTLGGSLRGKHLAFTPRVAEARWLVRHSPIHAMIDLSDGLSSDLQRLVEASGNKIGFEIQAVEVPISLAAQGRLNAALNDGEDFELLFTIDPRHATALRKQWRKKFKLPLTEIGRVVRSPGKVFLITANGRKLLLKPRGYDHFAP
jgi:thiamine-monophosphate kinase